MNEIVWYLEVLQNKKGEMSENINETRLAISL